MEIDAAVGTSTASENSLKDSKTLVLFHGQVQFHSCSTRRRCTIIQEGKRDNDGFKNRKI